MADSAHDIAIEFFLNAKRDLLGIAIEKANRLQREAERNGDNNPITRVGRFLAATEDVNRMITLNEQLIAIGVSPPGWSSDEWKALADALELPVEPLDHVRICSKAVGRARLIDGDRRRATDRRGLEFAPRPMYTKSGTPGGEILRSWIDIASAINAHTGQVIYKGKGEGYKKLAALSDAYNGPIVRGKKGKQPTVSKRALLEWWDSLEMRIEQLKANGTDRNQSAEISHGYGRSAKVAPEIGGSVRKGRRLK